MANKIKIGIAGGAGYTGGELIRILLNHPAAELVFVHSKSNAGKPLNSVHEDLVGSTELKFADNFTALKDGSIDLLFLCVGHRDAKKFLIENEINLQIKIIDLSQDFRLNNSSVIGNREFVYGLPELNKSAIQAATNIANPGCFATAIQLGLLPLAKAGLLNEVYSTGITGSTGAGQGLSPTSHFSWRGNNIQAYKTLSHQHLQEIHQSLHALQNNFSNAPSGNGGSLHFVPWRGDFTRGIFISSQFKCDLPLKQLNEMFETFYADSPFVHICTEPVFLKQVVNTNNCVIHIEQIENNVVIHSAIDNLLKGASGQAVQNMNLLFGIDESTGLKLKANYF